MRAGCRNPATVFGTIYLVDVAGKAIADADGPGLCDEHLVDSHSLEGLNEANRAAMRRQFPGRMISFKNSYIRYG
jgi:hypothetical protein